MAIGFHLSAADCPDGAAPAVSLSDYLVAITLSCCHRFGVVLIWGATDIYYCRFMIMSVHLSTAGCAEGAIQAVPS